MLRTKENDSGMAGLRGQYEFAFTEGQQHKTEAENAKEEIRRLQQQFESFRQEVGCMVSGERLATAQALHQGCCALM